MKGKKWDVYVYGDVNIDLVVPGVSSLPKPGQEDEVPVMDTYVGGGAALFSAAVDMTASYRATTSTTLLPASAVRGSGDNRYVYVVNEESNALGQRVLKVKKQDVKVLSEVGSTVSIQDDLSRQRVAYMEDRTISDGSEVMVYGE